MANLANARWGDDADSSDDEDVVQETSPVGGDGTDPELLPEPASSSSSSSSSTGGIAIPPTHTSRVDSKGIKVVTSYRHDPVNANRLLKTTTTIRVSHDKVRENVAVAARRKWKKFGQAAIDLDQSNVTIHSRDDIYMEDPHADVDLQEEDVAKAISGNLNAFWAKQNMRNLQRKYDVDGDDAGGKGGNDGGNADDGWTQVGAGGGGGGGGTKYVPPSARGGAGGPSMGGKSLAALAAAAPGEGGGDRRGGGGGSGVDRDQNTIRVTNISEDTTEADLQELFQPFGRISRVYLAKDKETMQSRGFAFVSFVHREDAASAMAKLQGHGYDHLILKLEWARPSAPKDPASGETQFRSGYGKALAQDTKEKVSYASNLTTGVR
jgi:translation initiation factor 3 subunit G